MKSGYNLSFAKVVNEKNYQKTLLRKTLARISGQGSGHGLVGLAKKAVRLRASGFGPGPDPPLKQSATQSLNDS